MLVNDDVIETEKPVKLQRGPSVMTASGMNYNNVTREMQLFGNVRGAIACVRHQRRRSFQVIRVNLIPSVTA